MKQLGNTRYCISVTFEMATCFFSVLTTPSQALGRLSVSPWKGNRNPASRQDAARENSRLQISIECKHWQTQMAHWKIHQHGKIAVLSTRAIPASGLQVSNEKGVCTCSPQTTKPDTERTRGSAVCVRKGWHQMPDYLNNYPICLQCRKTWPPSTNHGDFLGMCKRSENVEPLHGDLWTHTNTHS